MLIEVGGIMMLGNLIKISGCVDLYVMLGVVMFD